MNRFIVLAFFLSLNLCLTAQQQLLFIGNSLTYSNDMPVMLEELSSFNGRPISTNCICYPNYGLEDHVIDPDTKNRILNGKYDWVIFQQGPSSQAYGRSSLIQYGDSIVQWSKATGAIPALLMVWTSQQWAHTWPLVIQNHQEASIKIDSRLIRVGDVWKAYIDKYPNHDLYGFDNFHPSAFGSQLTAILIYQVVNPHNEIPLIPEEWRISKNRKNRLIKLLSN